MNRIQRFVSTAALALVVSAATAPAARAQDDVPTLEAGIALIQSDDYAGAARVFEQIVAAAPDDVLGWYYVGYCRHQLEDFDAALAANLKAVELGAGTGVGQSAAYNAACIYSLRAELDPAFELLVKLKEEGWAEWPLLRDDTDMENLRADPRFATLFPEAVPIPPFVEEDVRVIHVWKGESPREEFGWVATSAGDVDKDGVQDVIVGAPFFAQPSFSGRAYLYSGRSGEQIWMQSGLVGDQLGNAVDDAGDLDGDGHGDVLVGAPGHAGTPGRALVYSGADGSVLLEMAGEQEGESFGDEAWCPGDVSGDGKPDYLIGSPKYDGVGPDAGRVWLISGADGAVLHEFDGERAGDQFGSSTAGELEIGEPEIGQPRAGQPFIVIGAQDAGEGQRGRVYAYRGASFEPAFVIEADETAVNYGRFFLSLVGDLTGDGVLDVYSTDWENTALGPNTGRAYVHSGADGALVHAWTGEAAGAGFGIGNARCGDLTGDGVADLVIGAWQSAAGAPGAGRAFVFSGADGARVRTITCQLTGDAFGFDANGIGDVDGDGKIDLLITAAYHAENGPHSGAVYVIAGQ